MFKPFIKISILVAIAAIMCGSCSKDNDEQEPNNPYNGKTSAVFNPDVTYGTMTDQDGNIYKTVTIGTQTWMAENLRTTKYNDGTIIPNITDNNEWGALTTGAYCNYNNTTNVDTIATYGRLYNWYAVNTNKLAPKGWHVPSDAEWTQLINYLGGFSIAGGKLKETGTLHWDSSNAEATNESGFTALTGGLRISEYNYVDLGHAVLWWSTTEDDINNALSYSIYKHLSSIHRSLDNKYYGFSVRCLKD